MNDNNYLRKLGNIQIRKCGPLETTEFLFFKDIDIQITLKIDFQGTIAKQLTFKLENLNPKPKKDKFKICGFKRCINEDILRPDYIMIHLSSKGEEIDQIVRITSKDVGEINLFRDHFYTFIFNMHKKTCEELGSIENLSHIIPEGDPKTKDGTIIVSI